MNRLLRIDMFKNLFTITSALAISLLLTGCIPKSRIPVDTRFYGSLDQQPGRHLLILLPGRGDSMSDFEKRGLVHSLRSRHPQVDIIAVDLHMGYYIDESFLTRLKQDVFTPAKLKGYQQTWLFGISMGGMGALFYTKEYPEDINGTIIFAPFLGEEELIEEIIAAGGIRKWLPGKIQSDDHERKLWAWLKERTPDQLFLGFGKQDKFSMAHQLLQSWLPPEHSISIRGKHRWPVWIELWDLLLERLEVDDQAIRITIPSDVVTETRKQ